MSATPEKARHPRKLLLTSVLVGIVGAAVVQGLAIVLGGWPAFTGEFLGPDSYMRLSRVLECHAGTTCPEGIFPRSNAPFGESLHWPFLQDWLLMVLALPLRPILDFAGSVTTAAYLLGPVLELLAIFAVTLAAWPLVRRAGLPFVGLLFACQLWVVLAFAPARPDHHGLQALFFLGAMAGGIRLLLGRTELWLSILTGAFVALALWVSTEALVTLTILPVAVSLFWLARGGSRLARVNRMLVLSVTSVLAVGLIVDGPRPERFSVVFDRLSIAHWTLFALLTVFWWLVEGRPAAISLRRRLLWSGVGITVVAVVMLLGYPGIHLGPLAEVDPRILPLWLDRVPEYVPLLRDGDWGALVAGLGPLMVAIPVSLWQMLEGPRSTRPAWAFLLAAFAWFGLLGLVHGSRWAYYVHLLSPIPLAWLLARVLEACREQAPSLRAAVLATGWVLVFVLVPLLIPSLLSGTPGKGGALGSSACQARDLIPVLRSMRVEEVIPAQGSIPGKGSTSQGARVPEEAPTREEGSIARGDSRSIVLAPLSWGPEIVFRTDLDVVATPYHRNAQGILDSYAVMSARSAEAAFDVIRQRGIDYLALCFGMEWSPRAGDDPGTFYSALQHHRPTRWLQRLELPESLTARYGIWRVMNPEGGDPFGSQ
jgi:hypothetical protein